VVDRPEAAGLVIPKAITVESVGPTLGDDVDVSGKCVANVSRVDVLGSLDFLDGLHADAFYDVEALVERNRRPFGIGSTVNAINRKRESLRRKAIHRNLPFPLRADSGAQV
jgi:hypothetical protein